MSVTLLRWGSSEVPLLPEPLRQLWAEERLPRWLCKEIGFPEKSCVADLRSGPHSGQLSARAKKYLGFLIRTRQENIEGVAVLGRPWPARLEITSVPWSIRTLNCIHKEHLDDRVTELPFLTVGELLKIPAMGALSVLDFACTLEAAFNEVESSSTQEAATDHGDAGAKVSASLIEALDEPWSAWVSEQDLRFRDLLPAGRGTLSERIDFLTGDPTSSDRQLTDLAIAIPLVRQRIDEIAALPLEDALAQYIGVTASIDGERLSSLLARLQCSGESSPLTLEVAGASAGITRERLRQLQQRFFERRPTHPVVLPQLDAGLNLLLKQAPIDAVSASRLMRIDKISRRPFHPASLLAAAALCGRAAALTVLNIRGVSTVVAAADTLHSETVVRVARRLASSSGTSNVEEVAAVLRSKYKIDMEAQALASILKNFSDLEFLTDLWFWSPESPTDPVRSITRRMLSVTSPLDLTRVREGIRRQFRFRQSLARKRGHYLNIPPRTVLAAYFRAHPEFVLLSEEVVKPLRPLDYRVELAKTEQIMVDSLRSVASGVLDRSSIVDLCVERGMNAATVGTMLSYSSVIEPLGVGLWTLRGNRPDPAVVESLRRINALRPRQERIVDYGWTNDGEIWMAVTLPKNFESKTFLVPAAIRRIITGRDFNAVDENGIVAGSVHISDRGHCSGYRAFLTRAGADEGDVLFIKVSTLNNSATLRVGTPSEMDEHLDGPPELNEFDSE